MYNVTFGLSALYGGVHVDHLSMKVDNVHDYPIIAQTFNVRSARPSALTSDDLETPSAPVHILLFGIPLFVAVIFVYGRTY